MKQIDNFSSFIWNKPKNRDRCYSTLHYRSLLKGIGIGREEVTRNALVEGIPIELIKKISGLDEEALKHIQARF